MLEFFKKFGVKVTENQAKYLIIKLDDNSYSNKVKGIQLAKCLYRGYEEAGLPQYSPRKRLRSANGMNTD